MGAGWGNCATCKKPDNQPTPKAQLKPNAHTYTHIYLHTYIFPKKSKHPKTRLHELDDAGGDEDKAEDAEQQVAVLLGRLAEAALVHDFPGARDPQHAGDADDAEVWGVWGDCGGWGGLGGGVTIFNVMSCVCAAVGGCK